MVGINSGSSNWMRISLGISRCSKCSDVRKATFASPHPIEKSTAYKTKNNCKGNNKKKPGFVWGLEDKTQSKSGVRLRTNRVNQ